MLGCVQSRSPNWGSEVVPWPCHLMCNGGQPVCWSLVDGCCKEMYHMCLLIFMLHNTNISLSKKETADTQICLWDNNNSEELWQIINKHY